MKYGDDTASASKAKGTGGKTAPAAKDNSGSGSSISLAGAVGVNIASDTRTKHRFRELDDSAGGAVTLASSGTTDAEAGADGSSAGTAAWRRRGVALNLADATVSSTIGVGRKSRVWV